MSDSLDKLKALSSKLEKKLQAKKQKSLFELSSETKKEDSEKQRTVASIKNESSKNDKLSEKSVALPKQEKEEIKKEPSSTSNNDTLSKKTPQPTSSNKPIHEASSTNKNFESVRQENIDVLKRLYTKLHIDEKVPHFEQLFVYKAMNLSGIGLKEEDFGQIREGKYIQIITITYEPDKNGKKKAKNISLGYFGKAETLDEKLKNDIIEFVLRWRYEKAFQNVDHYKILLDKLQ